MESQDLKTVLKEEKKAKKEDEQIRVHKKPMYSYGI